MNIGYLIRFACFLTLAAGFVCPCEAQVSSSSSQSTSDPALAAGAPLSDLSRPMTPVGQAGGNSLANFPELMSLIQTIVKSNWEAEGGDDKMAPYPNGVWIDPNGKLNRQKGATPSLASRLPQPVAGETKFFEIPGLGVLQSTAEVRWVSLNDIERRLQENRASKLMASPALELLGGLTRIDYLYRHPETQEWLLGGPAGDLVMDRQGNLVGRSTGLPPVLLEDLLSIAPVILNGRGPLGCTIDPVPERLKAVSELVASPTAARSLAQHAAKWTERLAETLGDQQATIFGLPDDSPTGVALLIADEHMKRVGLGLEKGPARLLSYWEEGEKRGALKTSGLIRWWFALRDDIRIGVDEHSTYFALESPTVRVMSQRQWMDQTGARHASDENDIAANAFAAGFTEHFSELQTMYSAYGRLRHIFDLSVVLRLIREENEAGRGKSLSLLMDRSIQPHASEPLKWIPSTVAWRKTSNGRITAIVSGGVSIDAKSISIGRESGRTQPSDVAAFPFEKK